MVDWNFSGSRRIERQQYFLRPAEQRACLSMLASAQLAPKQYSEWFQFDEYKDAERFCVYKACRSPDEHR